MIPQSQRMLPSSSNVEMIDSNGVVRRRIRAGHMTSTNGLSTVSSNNKTHNKMPTDCGFVEKSPPELISVTGVTNMKCLACSDGNYVAHASGSAIVVEPECSDNTSFILNSYKRNISSLCCSADGRFLATGESGHNPKVRIFDLNSKNQIAELQGHRYSIDCVRMSPVNPYIIVSIGSIHDTGVNVWNWKCKTRIASNNVCAEVNGVQFSETSSYFVTVGIRHVKFWYLSKMKSSNSAGMVNTQQPFRASTLKGRSCILGEHKQNIFRDVLCYQHTGEDGSSEDHVVVLTQSGLLIEIDSEDRVVQRWVDVTTSQANCMVGTDSFIIIGCASGIARIFDHDFTFIANIPFPNTKYGIPQTTYPAITALAFNSIGRRLHVIYDDHSRISWDCSNGLEFHRIREQISHCSCVWAIDTIKDSSSEHIVTGSSDGTIRFWTSSEGNLECQRIIVPDETPHEHPAAVRSLCVCKSLGHMAVGDSSGNISIYSSEDPINCTKIPPTKIAILEAHENDVLSLTYSHKYSADDRVILASSGRDRIIHLLDASSKKYEPLGSVSDHSGSIQAVHLVNYPKKFNEYILVSCGADKAIVVRKCTFEPTPDDELKITRLYQLCERQSLTDLVIDRASDQFLAAYQDRFVRIYHLNVTPNRVSHQQQFKGCTCTDGSLVRMNLLDLGSNEKQRSITVLATACSRKRVYIWRWTRSVNARTLLSIISGAHSDPVTDMRFIESGEYLVTCSADSCLMVWKVQSLKSLKECRPETSRRNTELTAPLIHVRTSPRRKRWSPIDRSPILNRDEQPESTVILYDDYSDQEQCQHKEALHSPLLNNNHCEDDRLSSTTWTRADENVPPLSLQLKACINDLVNDYKSTPSDDILDSLIWARNSLSTVIDAAGGRVSEQDPYVSRSEVVQKLCRLRSQNQDLHRRAESMIDAILGPLLDLAEAAKKDKKDVA